MPQLQRETLGIEELKSKASVTQLQRLKRKQTKELEHDKGENRDHIRRTVAVINKMVDLRRLVKQIGRLYDNLTVVRFFMASGIITAFFQN